MRNMKRASLISLCLVMLMALGACSGGGSPVSAGTQPTENYSSSITGNIFKDGGPVASGFVFAYDLETLSLFNESTIGPNGSFTIGVDPGQYLIIPVAPVGWKPPVLTQSFSNYVNIGDNTAYRMDIDLSTTLAAGDEIIFGFVTSTDNSLPIVGATVEAANKSTTTDGYGFYSMSVPGGTAQFKISANGFYDLHKNIREGQVDAGFFTTPFFNLNPTNTIGGSLGGAVRDVTDGSGLGGVRISLMMPGDPSFSPVQYLTNLGGTYRFYNLAEGIYKMQFERPGYVDGTREGLILKDQDDAIINVFMNVDTADRASISGFVRNSGIPLPVTNARVTIANPLIGNMTAITNFSGFYEFTDVIPGDYTMTVVSPGAGVTFYEAESTYQTFVAGPNTIDFGLRFIEEGVLRGEVTLSDPGGGPFAFPPTGVEVTAEKVGGPLTGVKWKTNTDGKGQFVFNGIPAGTYLVKGSIDFSADESFFGLMSNVGVTAGTTTNIDLALSVQ